jgi:hypothetical protein
VINIDQPLGIGLTHALDLPHVLDQIHEQHVGRVDVGPMYSSCLDFHFGNICAALSDPITAVSHSSLNITKLSSHFPETVGVASSRLPLSTTLWPRCVFLSHGILSRRLFRRCLWTAGSLVFLFRSARRGLRGPVRRFQFVVDIVQRFNGRRDRLLSLTRI